MNRGCGRQWARGRRRLWCTSEDDEPGEGKLRISDPELGVSADVCDEGLAVCDGAGSDVDSISSSSSTTSVIVDVF